jgi:hypothetical protein
MKNYSKLTDEEKKDIAELYYKNTMTIAEMTLSLGLTARTIPQVLKEAGINTRITNRYTLNENYFSEIDTEEKAYLLGMLYADGFVGDEKHNNIVLSLKKSDRHLLERFAELIEFTGEIRDSKTKNGYGEGFQCILNFSSPKMAGDLRDIGVYPGKSLTMTELPNIDESLLRHFVRGYFDGDGGISSTTYVETDRRSSGRVRVYDRTNFSFTLIGTEPFLSKIQSILPAETFFYDSKTEEMKYLCTRSESSICEIYKYLYDESSIFLHRKFDSWQEIIGAINEKSLMKMG